MSLADDPVLKALRNLISKHRLRKSLLAKLRNLYNKCGEGVPDNVTDVVWWQGKNTDVTQEQVKAFINMIAPWRGITVQPQSSKNPKVYPENSLVIQVRKGNKLIKQMKQKGGLADWLLGEDLLSQGTEGETKEEKKPDYDSGNESDDSNITIVASDDENRREENADVDDGYDNDQTKPLPSEQEEKIRNPLQLFTAYIKKNKTWKDQTIQDLYNTIFGDSNVEITEANLKTAARLLTKWNSKHKYKGRAKGTRFKQVGSSFNALAKLLRDPGDWGRIKKIMNV